MDTIVQNCIECGIETDCIEGICLDCRLKKDSHFSKNTALIMLNNIEAEAKSEFPNRDQILDTCKWLRVELEKT